MYATYFILCYIVAKLIAIKQGCINFHLYDFKMIWEAFEEERYKKK